VKCSGSAAAINMDEIVAAAMRKWPNVPDVYNWLRLDERGRWRVRARDYESSGRFETIGNPAVVEFIGRNYQADNLGRWFFQNGPQRVFVGFACAPWVYRFDPVQMPATHTGIAAIRIDAVLLDEQHTPILVTDLGPGAVSDLDYATFIGALRDATGAPMGDAALDAWLAGAATIDIYCQTAGTVNPVLPITRIELASRYAFVADPQPPGGAPDCA